MQGVKIIIPKKSSLLMSYCCLECKKITKNTKFKYEKHGVGEESSLQFKHVCIILSVSQYGAVFNVEALFCKFYSTFNENSHKTSICLYKL